MPELALDDVNRHPFARELHGVRVPQLVVVPTSAQSLLSSPRGVNVPTLLVITVVDMYATVRVRTVDGDAVSGYDKNGVLLGGNSLTLAAGEGPGEGNEERGLDESAVVCVAR